MSYRVLFGTRVVPCSIEDIDGVVEQVVREWLTTSPLIRACHYDDYDIEAVLPPLRDGGFKECPAGQWTVVWQPLKRVPGRYTGPPEYCYPDDYVAIESPRYCYVTVDESVPWLPEGVRKWHAEVDEMTQLGLAKRRRGTPAFKPWRMR